MDYLEGLDSVIAGGLSQFGRDFRGVQADFVCRHQNPDGGFSGREGASDLYYTDFALRALTVLSADRTPFTRAARYLETIPQPADIVEAFNILNCRRMLRSRSLAEGFPVAGIREALAAQKSPDGGYARPGATATSAYNTFLGALCLQMMDEPFPNIDAAVEAIGSLQTESGGFAETPDQQIAQTNATAAGASFLNMVAATQAFDRDACVQFIRRMQTSGGGVCAHADAGTADLLSTFTALSTALMLDRLDALNVAAITRFVRSVVATDGGFRAHAQDIAADVEYTYYGLGCLGICRTVAGPQRV